MSTSLRDLAPNTRPKVSEWLASLRDAGVQGQVTSTRRSTAEQTRLYNRFVAGQSLLPAAFPGTSKHEIGVAIDIVFPTDEELAIAVDAAEEFGLRWAGPGDPVHFEDLEQPEDEDEAEQAVAATLAAGKFRRDVDVSLSPIGTLTDIVTSKVKGFFGIGDHLCCKR